MNNREIADIISARLRNCIANYAKVEESREIFDAHEIAAILILDGATEFTDEAELYLLGYLNGVKVALGLDGIT